MLFVTLRRGLAGKKESYLATLKSLGLRKPRQEIAVQNNAASRGQIEKVRPLHREGRLLPPPSERVTTKTTPDASNSVRRVSFLFATPHLDVFLA